MEKVMELTNTGKRLSLCAQKLRYQFYLQFDYDTEFMLYRIFKIHFNGGFSSWYHIYQPTTDYITYNSYGFFFDFTILNIRFGIYLHPFLKRKKSA